MPGRLTTKKSLALQTVSRGPGMKTCDFLQRTADSWIISYVFAVPLTHYIVAAAISHADCLLSAIRYVGRGGCRRALGDRGNGATRLLSFVHLLERQLDASLSQPHY